MRQFIKLCVALCSVAIGLSYMPLWAQNAKTLVVQPKSGEYAGRTFYTNSHALLIGISRYQFLPKDRWLNYADRDATDLREVLVRFYGFAPENVKLLLNEEATKTTIEAALSTLADQNEIRKDDRLLVFFSGHGQTVKLANGGDTGFLIPYDANVNLDQPNNQGPYLRSCLRMNSMWDYLQGSPAKHALLLADACYGGLLAKSRDLSEKPNALVVSRLLTIPALQVLTAGSKGQEAFEKPELGHGVFTFKLLEKLRARAANPDDVFLASELASEMKVSVGNATDSRQTPQFGNYGDTEGDWVWVTTKPQSVPPLENALLLSPVTPPLTPAIVSANAALRAALNMDGFEDAPEQHEALSKAIAAGANDVSATNEKGYNKGWTALHYMAMFKDETSVALLLARGAQVNAKGKDKETPLGIAAGINAVKIAELLIKNGADVNDAGNDIGFTPLHRSISNNGDVVAALLINQGAKIEAKDSDHMTPLHRAAQMNADRVVKILLERGADINAKEVLGQTPLEVAIEANATKVIPLLQAATKK